MKTNCTKIYVNFYSIDQKMFKLHHCGSYLKSHKKSFLKKRKKKKRKNCRLSFILEMLGTLQTIKYGLLPASNHHSKVIRTITYSTHSFLFFQNYIFPSFFFLLPLLFTQFPALPHKFIVRFIFLSLSFSLSLFFFLSTFFSLS